LVHQRFQTASHQPHSWNGLKIDIGIINHIIKIQAQAEKLRFRDVLVWTVGLTAEI